MNFFLKLQLFWLFYSQNYLISLIFKYHVYFNYHISLISFIFGYQTFLSFYSNYHILLRAVYPLEFQFLL